MRAPWIVAGCLIAGCSSLLGITDPAARTDGGSGSDGSGSDGKGSDGGGGDTPGDVGPPSGSPVLLSEVVLAPSGGEMIEIVNTSPDPVDLSNYFLSDNGDYFRMPTGVPVNDALNDFVVQFPAGTIMPGHDVFTVAVASSGEFQLAYGLPPTFSIASGTMNLISGAAAPNLTSGGEAIVLFFWDGASDVVQDADILLAGSPSAANSLIAKSNVQQDGPDADSAKTAYKVDAGTITIQTGTPGNGTSTKRIALEANHETHDGGGNGLAGEDETSEDTAATWDSGVFSIPDPGIVPAALLQ